VQFATKHQRQYMIFKRKQGNKWMEESYLGTSHLKSEKLMRKAKVC
jgi:hypothetical protein